MFDFHIHVACDGGGLLPAEAMRLAKNAGFRAVGLVVRADMATLPLLLPRLLPMVKTCSLYAGVEAFAGVELVQVPPALFPSAVEEARGLGASLVLGHGEGVPGVFVDAVEQGTNLAAIAAGVDILAHPGMITAEDAALAAEKGVLLELSAASRHGLANGHVVSMGAKHGCSFVFGSNARSVRDFTGPEGMRALYRAVEAGACAVPGALDIAARALTQRLLRPLLFSA